ncbi:hypothetical protein [Streptomyces shenzhenensis]|uniref:hypothetical protein n=1 Tax=Streptomyces shenzhenensis TaxID=943815 RepID=UPI0015F0B071|nr:hypothetical protein [Streptomyces shenzhenensis]
MQERTAPRLLGTDPLTGKTAFAVTEPGSPLDLVADTAAIEAAVALHAVVTTILEAGDALGDAERAVFLEPVTTALGSLIAVAAKHVDRAPNGERLTSAAARVMFEALRRRN